MRSLIRTLITSPTGLGYCCPWAFFSIFRKTAVIADRLGMTQRAVQMAKRRVDEGEWKCEQCGNCMKEQVRTVKLMGKKTLGL